MLLSSISTLSLPSAASRMEFGFFGELFIDVLSSSLTSSTDCLCRCFIAIARAVSADSLRRLVTVLLSAPTKFFISYFRRCFPFLSCHYLRLHCERCHEF